MPASTTLTGSNVPLLTRKPENGMIISLGIGMSALSKTLSKKIPGYPKVDMNDITKSMTSFRISNVIDNRWLENSRHKYLFIFQGPLNFMITCRRRDLSPRPFDYESNALTKLSYPGAQLLEHNDFLKHNIFYSKHFSLSIETLLVTLVSEQS